MYTMKVSMNRIKHQSKSGTKCFLCQVIQMDLDLENPDPLVNYDYSSSSQPDSLFFIRAGDFHLNGSLHGSLTRKFFLDDQL